MQEILNEIIQLTQHHATTQPTATALPGVVLIKGEVPEHQLSAVYTPMVGFVVQGAKIITIGEQVFSAFAPSYFVIPTDIPVRGRVYQGHDGLPYLSVGLNLNQKSLLELFEDLPRSQMPEHGVQGFAACEVEREFIDVWLRMLRLLKTPQDIPALASVYEREILYRVWTGPQGWRLRQLCRTGSFTSGIHRAIRWLRENYTQAIDIKQIADQSDLGVTTFHRQFKQITGLSPIQFQKQLRLLEARNLLFLSNSSVSDAAYAVGYESSSQFNREYARFFGAPPARDAARLRHII
jgi:AraC-like DNA-binding protein